MHRRRWPLGYFCVAPVMTWINGETPVPPGAKGLGALVSLVGCRVGSVRAERRGGQAGGVDQIDRRVVGPAVTHGDGAGHLRGGDNDFVAVDDRVRPVPWTILAADGKPLELALRTVAHQRSEGVSFETERIGFGQGCGLQASVGMFESDNGLAISKMDGVEDRSGVG